MPRDLEVEYEGFIGPSNLSKKNEELLSLSLTKLVNFNITGRVTFTRSISPKHGGGFADVHTSVYESPDRGELTVAIKCLRQIGQDSFIAKIAAKEIYIWSKLIHDNLLRLEGFIIEAEHNLPSLVSEWMDNGTVLKYVKGHPNCDVVHLSNVLVNSSGNAVICDFGISRATNATQSALGGNPTAPGGPGGSIRWMAHELIAEANIYTKHTKESDVWAFGMTAYELMTKGLPYADIINNIQVQLAISKGTLPSRPPSFEVWPKGGLQVWDLMQSCWNLKPQFRISMANVVKELNALKSELDSETLGMEEMSSTSSPVPKGFSNDQTGRGTHHAEEGVLSPVDKGIEQRNDPDLTAVIMEGESFNPEGEDSGLTSFTQVAKTQEQEEMTSDDTVVLNGSLPIQNNLPSVLPVEDTPETYVEEPTLSVIARDFGIKGAEKSSSNDLISPKTPSLPLLMAGAAAGGDVREHEGAVNGAEEGKFIPSPEKPRVTPKETKRFIPWLLSTVFGGCSSLLCR